MTQPKATPVSDPSLTAMSLANRLPEFFKQEPRLYFAQFEAVIAPQKASDEAKYQLVIAKLQLDELRQVSDIITNPPQEDKYETIKARLISVYVDSEFRSFQKLLSEMELGDQKPSQLLRRMRDLAGAKMQDEALHFMWVGHLPKHVRSILAVSDQKNLTELATLADTIIENTRGMDEIAQVDAQQSQRRNSPPRERNMETIIAELTRKIDDLTTTVNGINTYQHQSRNQQRQSHGGYRSRSRSGNRNNQQEKREKSRPPNWKCYYHHRFGADAKKCTEPCAWKKQEN